MNTRDAEIKFTISLSDPDDPRHVQKTAGVVRGKVGRSSTSLYLIFRAAMADVGPADYTIRVGAGEALILRRGALAMRQPLVAGQMAAGTYDAAYGSLMTRAAAERIHAVMDEGGVSGAVRLIYTLRVQGQPVGRVTHDYHYRMTADHDEIQAKVLLEGIEHGDCGTS